MLPTKALHDLRTLLTVCGMLYDCYHGHVRGTFIGALFVHQAVSAFAA